MDGKSSLSYWGKVRSGLFLYENASLGYAVLFNVGYFQLKNAHWKGEIIFCSPTPVFREYLKNGVPAHKSRIDLVCKF